MTSTTEKSAGFMVAKAIGLVAIYVVGALIANLVALFVAMDGGDVAEGLLWRAVLVGLVLVVVTAFTDRSRSIVHLVGIALAAYALNPMTWNGRAFLGQIWFEPGLVTIVLDGLVWLGLVAVTGWSVRTVLRRS